MAHLVGLFTGRKDIHGCSKFSLKPFERSSVAGHPLHHSLGLLQLLPQI